jgi:hypothetical protein
MAKGDRAMIKHEDFYWPDDIPDRKREDAMWRSIRQSVAPLRSGPLFIRDERSFVFGMAATIVLGLALVGAWAIARQAFENARPQPLKLEQAYVSAIHEFERVVPTVNVNTARYPQVAGQLSERKEQLKLVDEAIAELRRQTNRTDLSPLKRERLRGLYSTKLQILQQMIEEGEIEL